MKYTNIQKMVGDNLNIKVSQYDFRNELQADLRQLNTISYGLKLFRDME